MPLFYWPLLWRPVMVSSYWLLFSFNSNLLKLSNTLSIKCWNYGIITLVSKNNCWSGSQLQNIFFKKAALDRNTIRRNTKMLFMIVNKNVEEILMVPQWRRGDVLVLVIILEHLKSVARVVPFLSMLILFLLWYHFSCTNIWSTNILLSVF